ncbi:MAG: hypothetical protein ACREQ9_25915 [Candidatus Binatia bacterium]
MTVAMWMTGGATVRVIVRSSSARLDRGEWAMRSGVACELGEPVLVDYEEFFARPEPHYLS